MQGGIAHLDSAQIQVHDVFIDPSVAVGRPRVDRAPDERTHQQGNDRCDRKVPRRCGIDMVVHALPQLWSRNLNHNPRMNKPWVVPTRSLPQGEGLIIGVVRPFWRIVWRITSPSPSARARQAGGPAGVLSD